MAVCLTKDVNHALLCVLLALVTGCSSQLRLGEVARGDKLSIKTAAPAFNDADAISNAAIVSDAKTGAGAGVVTGAVWGLSCGFFALVCVPAGAVAGAVVGGSTGAIVGSLQGLSNEQARQLNANLVNSLQSHDPAAALHSALVARASREWTIVESDVEEVELSVELAELGLRSLGRDRVSMTLSLRALTKPAPIAGNRRERSATFRYESAPAPVASWVDDYDDFIVRRLQEGYLVLSEDIVAAMLGKPER